MPNLLDVQKDSYKWFIDEGLREVFEDINPITDFSGNLSLEFIDFNLTGDPKYTIEEAKERDATYSAPLKVKVRLTNEETKEKQEHEIFMGDFPLMTETGTFIINGAERVIVSQLVRSPGIYYAKTIDKTGKPLFSSTVIPNRGAWLEYETDSNDIFYVRVDRTRKIPVTVLIRALGVGTDSEILELFGEDPKLLATIERDNSKSVEEGLIEIYKRIRPGEPPTVESSQSLLYSMFYDNKRYNLARVGRYKFNKKLALRNRVNGLTLAEDVVDASTGELLATAGTRIDMSLADTIQNAGISYIWVTKEDQKIKILSNLAVDIHAHLDLTEEELYEAGIGELVYYPVLEEILDMQLEWNELKAMLKKESYRLVPRHITFEDIMGRRPRHRRPQRALALVRVGPAVCRGGVLAAVRPHPGPAARLCDVGAAVCRRAFALAHGLLVRVLLYPGAQLAAAQRGVGGLVRAFVRAAVCAVADRVCQRGPVSRIHLPALCIARGRGDLPCHVRAAGSPRGPLFDLRASHGNRIHPMAQYPRHGTVCHQALGPVQA